MAEPKGLVQEFKEFVLRGNVVDLAVAVVIGTAFGLVVKAFVADIITPLVAAIFGKPSFESLFFTIHKSHFLYGDLINNIFNFLIIALVIFLFIVKPLNALMARRKTEPDVASMTKECPECLSSIPAAARRCAFCTAAQTV